MYANGQGVPKDYDKAREWYGKAAAKGFLPAKTLLASLAITEKVNNAKEQGYRVEAFDDFRLDGKELAAGGAKLLMQGFYFKMGNMEYLQPNALAVAEVREYGSSNKSISLLTEDASRDIRKVFLECSDNLANPLGCSVTVIGHADTCTLTSALTPARSLPCLTIEDGWPNNR